MAKSFIELVVGDLGEKRDYRQFMKRVKALPRDYRYAFKKIQNYMYYFGDAVCDMTMYTDLLELLEVSAAEEKGVLDILGSDVAAFCDDLIRASASNTITTREKLNQEVLEYFYKEENSHDKYHQKNT